MKPSAWTLNMADDEHFLADNFEEHLDTWLVVYKFLELLMKLDLYPSITTQDGQVLPMSKDAPEYKAWYAAKNPILPTPV